MNGFPKSFGSRQDVVNMLQDQAYHDAMIAIVQTWLDERFQWVRQSDVDPGTQVMSTPGMRVHTEYDDMGRPLVRHLDRWAAVNSDGLSRLGITVAEAVSWGCQDRTIDVPADRIASIRATAKARIDSWSDARMFGLFIDSQRNTYKVNRSVRDWMTGLEAKLAGGMVFPEGFTWDDASGNAIHHTAATFRALTAEITLWTDALYRTAAAAQGAVDTSSDAWEVDAILCGIVWPAGSPL